MAAREMIWHYAPLDMRRAVWDQIRGRLYLLANAAPNQGLPFARRFPEPPGMDAWRQTHKEPGILDQPGS
jgi:hypothetical protein